jgi:phosphatidylserine/phosphatidylglycerophosphate/cardiolipin synthase-like enzyme
MSVARKIVDRVDRGVGAGLERWVRGHHHRRLDRLGHTSVFEFAAGSGLWALTDPPPRPGNSVEVLVDGERACGAIAKALMGAHSQVHIAGWHLTPGFELTRDGDTSTVRDILAHLAERVDVRVLLWAGPPLPAFQPTRKMVRAVREQLTAGTRIECVMDFRERTMHCHHEKLVIVDDTVAFVGGIDLTSLSGDRWDSTEHQPRGSLGWHDVATKLRGPIVADVANHFRQRWQEAAAQVLPVPDVPAPAGHVTAQLLRTIPERTYGFSARGEFGILEAYERALRSAQHLIYLENQFLWSTEIAQILVDKLRNPPNEQFRILLLLPAKPDNGADTTRGQLGCLVEADDGAGRLLAVTIHSHNPGSTDALYVHAKVAIVDDRWLTVGSANLNEHSLFNDTEVNIVTCDPELTRHTRLALWAEHLHRAVEEIGHDPTTVIDGLWRPIAEEQLHHQRSGIALTHRLMQLPAVSRHAERLVGPMRGLLIDG